MAMRATTVRFSEDVWGLLEREAQREGVSAAQFVRDATVMRVGYAMGRRGDSIAGDGDEQAMLDVEAAVRDPERLAALRATGLLNSPPTPGFDRHARLAAQVLNAPSAVVSLVDEDGQFFKSCLGIPEPWASDRGTPLSHSFCQHAVARREPLVIDDAREHPVLRHNPAIQDMGVIAYAGAPLIDRSGHALGTLCVLDSRPRQWSRHQVEMLVDLAASVVSEIELAR
jgi:GAF domain-containing protein